ncbi:YidC/Oxa1 family membrane protein insertase [Thermicanus aegyptius]|uniref:YidC/Oxa1 family membrane protein insertase n=1 Tax=Thermicanus aegyptius TaxID=94009 RepID=UPI0012EC362F|nr:membrane protein insertase YidC [Thermicanus aegyptius]
MFITLLTGCGSVNTPPDPRNGFWDAFFVYPLYWLLDFLAQNMWGSYGLAIVIMTLMVRFAILPLTVKQYKSSLEMQKIQPEMMKIREKYKDNAQKMQEEMMKLYQKHGVNPMAGCLPLLIQAPILIAFYNAISRSEHIRESSFLWLQLGSSDPFFILPILAALFTYIQMRVMNSINPAQMSNPQIKMMNNIMPFFILFMAISLPSALSLYWVVGNLFSIGQTYLLKDLMKREPVKERA